METSAFGWPPWLITFWYLLISEQLYMLTHCALTWFLQIQRYQNGIKQGGHPIALVSMATTLCETRLIAGFDHLSWVFDHWSRGSRHLRESDQRGRIFLATESVNSFRISAPQWWPLREGRDGKCEGRNEKCKFLARECVSSSPVVRIFYKEKCKLITKFSATMVTSLPFLFPSLSLSLSPSVPHV